MINWKSLRSKIPHRVQISKKVFYEILWVDSFPDPLILGESRYTDRQIVIKNGLSPKESVSTYLHEITHAFSEENNLKLTENQVIAIENSLTYLLKNDNVFKGKTNETRRKASRKVRRTRKKTR